MHQELKNTKPSKSSTSQSSLHLDSYNVEASGVPSAILKKVMRLLLFSYSILSILLKWYGEKSFYALIFFACSNQGVQVAILYS